MEEREAPEDGRTVTRETSEQSERHRESKHSRVKITLSIASSTIPRAAQTGHGGLFPVSSCLLPALPLPSLVSGPVGGCCTHRWATDRVKWADVWICVASDPGSLASWSSEIVSFHTLSSENHSLQVSLVQALATHHPSTWDEAGSSPLCYP